MPSAGKIGHSLVALTAVALLATALAPAGCGSSGDTTATGGTGGGSSSGQSTAPGTQRATPKAPIGSTVESCHDDLLSEPARAAGVGCGETRSVVTRWVHTSSCMSSVGQSRGSCTVGGYGCLSTRTGRGVAVSCARPGRAISFEIAVAEP